MEKDELKRYLADGWSLERIGAQVGKHPETVSYWVRKHGLKPNGRAKHAARGAISREELTRAVEFGLTIAELADQFNRSKATVRYWMKRYGLRSKNRVGPRSLSDFSAAKAAGDIDAMGICVHHGETEFTREGSGYYRCKRCRQERVSERRRVVKAVLVAEAGGCCRICGFDEHPAALQFHHLNPAQKAFTVSRRSVSLQSLREEARQCVLLCANCHAQVEVGAVELPLECRASVSESPTG